MKNLLYIFLTVIVTSCTQQNPIEKTLTNKPGEYWTYYTSNSNLVTYFKFEDDQLSYRFYRDRDSCKFYEYSKNTEPPRKWSVSKDSVLTWNSFNYDVVSYNDKAVVLLYFTKEEPFTSYVFLIKEDKKPREGAGDFEQKRRFNPEKYPFSK